MATGYFNDDHHLDFAVANHGSSNVSIFVNQGDGTFEEDPVRVDVGDRPTSLSALNMDNDGDPDLVVTTGQFGVDAAVKVLRNIDGRMCFEESPSGVLGSAAWPQSYAFSAVDASMLFAATDADGPPLAAIHSSQVFLFDNTIQGGTLKVPMETANEQVTGVNLGMRSPPELVVLDQGATEGNPDTTFLFTVSLSRAGSLPVDVDWLVIDGTAKRDEDYNVAPSGTLHFDAGTTVQSIEVTVLGGLTVEADETFTVLLSNPRGATLPDDTAIVTIVDNDAATLTLEGVSASQDEDAGGTTTSFTFSVTLDNAVQGGLDLAYSTNDDTATLADGDYVYNDGTLEFAGTAGEIHTITVIVNDDAKVEADELFQIILGTISGLAAGIDPDELSLLGTPVSGTITNDDTATLSIGDVTLAEGNSGTTAFEFTITLSEEVAEDVTVVVNTADIAGQATAGIDYTAVSDLLVTFTAGGDLTQWVTVNVTGERVVENDETFEVNLTDARFGGAVDATRVTIADPQGIGTILNHEDAATLSIGDVSLNEGDSGTTAFEFRITLSEEVAEDVTLVVNTADIAGQATAGVDYTAVSDLLVTFTAGGDLTQWVTVNVTGERVVENDETFEVNLTDARFGGAVDATRVTIADPQGIGTIENYDTATFSINDQTVDESAGTLTLTISLDNPVDIPVVVDVTYTDVTATGGNVDYDSATDQVTFAAGDTTDKTVTVAVVNDTLVELSETFTAGLSTATPLGTRIIDLTDTGTGTITDNDTATFTINDQAVDESAGTLTLTISLDNPVDIPVVVDVTYTDVTATGGNVDYDSATDQVTFAAGDTTDKTVTVAVVNDTLVELSETFTAGLSTATPLGTRIIDLTDTGTGTITDDDTATFTISDQAVDESAGTLTLTISLDNPVDIPVVVDVTYTDVTATGGNVDYDSAADQVTFAAGDTTDKTVTVAVVNDTLVELSETFTAGLSTATPLGTRIIDLTDTGTGTITDDDTATFTISDQAVDESAGTLTLTISLDNPVDIPVVVDVTYTDVTATGGNVDYDSATDQVTFAAGDTTDKTVTVAVVNDTLVELSETFTAGLSTATPLGTRIIDLTDTGTGTITDDDTATFTISDQAVDESAGTLTLTISLDNPVDIPVVVDVTYTDVTATGGNVDYDSATDQVTFAAGDTTDKTVTVAVVNDTLVELSETFTAGLSTATALGTRLIDLTDIGTGTITDNDQPAATIVARHIFYNNTPSTTAKVQPPIPVTMWPSPPTRRHSFRVIRPRPLSTTPATPAASTGS